MGGVSPLPVNQNVPSGRESDMSLDMLSTATKVLTNDGMLGV
jgi:hypothetical protein